VRRVKMAEELESENEVAKWARCALG